MSVFTFYCSLYQLEFSKEIDQEMMCVCLCVHVCRHVCMPVLYLYTYKEIYHKKSAYMLWRLRKPQICHGQAGNPAKLTVWFWSQA